MVGADNLPARQQEAATSVRRSHIAEAVHSQGLGCSAGKAAAGEELASRAVGNHLEDIQPAEHCMLRVGQVQVEAGCIHRSHPVVDHWDGRLLSRLWCRKKRQWHPA